MIGSIGALFGVALGYFLRKKIAQAQANSIEAKADKIITEAKTHQQEIIIQGKEKAAHRDGPASRISLELRKGFISAGLDAAPRPALP